MDVFWQAIIPVLITGLVSLILFRWQMKKEKDKDSADASKSYGEAWNLLVDDLRAELMRQKEVRQEKEKELLKEFDDLKDQIDTNAQHFQDLLEDQRKLHLKIVNELRAELDKLHLENKELKEQNAALTKLVNAQTERLQLLQEAKDALLADVKRLKQTTGELKKNGTKR